MLIDIFIVIVVVVHMQWEMKNKIWWKYVCMSDALLIVYTENNENSSFKVVPWGSNTLYIIGNNEGKVSTKDYCTWVLWLTCGVNNLSYCLMQGVSTSTCLSCVKTGIGSLS